MGEICYRTVQRIMGIRSSPRTVSMWRTTKTVAKTGGRRPEQRDNKELVSVRKSMQPRFSRLPRTGVPPHPSCTLSAGRTPTVWRSKTGHIPAIRRSSEFERSIGPGSPLAREACAGQSAVWNGAWRPLNPLRRAGLPSADRGGGQTGLAGSSLEKVLAKWRFCPLKGTSPVRFQSPGRHSWATKRAFSR